MENKQSPFADLANKENAFDYIKNASYSELEHPEDFQHKYNHDESAIAPSIEADAETNTTPSQPSTTKKPSKKAKPLTIDYLARHLHDLNISLRTNDITHDLEIIGRMKYVDPIDGIEKDENPEHLKKNLTTILSEKFKDDKYNFTTGSISAESIGRMAELLADRNHFNPVLDEIENTKWDKVDRFEKVYSMLGLTDDTHKLLVKKFLLQAVALLVNPHDNPYSPDGILVLQGAQGIGKTSFFRALSGFNPLLFKSGVNISFNDKDTLIRATGSFLTEFGEIEHLLHSNSKEQVKAFITQEMDEIRTPYGRKAEKVPRRTSFCGTCNSDTFLNDVTGNRRFWVIPVGGVIHWEKFTPYDSIQLWRQCYDIVIDKYGNAIQREFRLSSTERDELEKLNKEYLEMLPAEREIVDILSDKTKENWTFKYMTLTEFKSRFSELSRYTSQQVGVVFKKLNIESRRTSHARMYLLPDIKFSFAPCNKEAISEETLEDVIEI